MSSTAIRIENISKMYRLGVIGYGTLKDDLKSAWARFRGSQDPNATIGKPSRLGEHGEFWALRDITLDIQQGDRVGIIGRNGAGKSTLLKVLSRVTAPTQGRISINGRIASLLEVGTGFHPELTGRENVFLNGAILGMRRREIQRKFDEIIEFSGVGEFVDTPVKRYSSGMYVRLAFSVAAHLDSDILIVDEVLAVGDAEFQKKCLGKMEDVSKGQGRTILFVSHNINAIETLCTKGVFLDAGLKVSTATDIKTVVQQYLGSGTTAKTIKTVDIEDEYLKLVSYDLVDEHFQSVSDKVVKNSEDLYVNIVIDLKKIDPLFNVGYAIYSEDGVLLYWSLTTDVEPESWLQYKIGRNSFRGIIPRRFLNEGVYRIQLVASIHMQKAIIAPEYNSPYLTVTIVGGLSDSPLWYQKRPGLMAPVLKWESIRSGEGI